MPSYRKTVNTPSFKICTACDGLGYLNHQRIFKEDGIITSEVKREQNCLACFGKGEIYG